MSAADALAAIARYSADAGGNAEDSPLQNGTRVRLSMPSGVAALNVYPSKGGGCKVVFDNPESAIADAIAALLVASPSVTASKSAVTGDLAPAVEAACWVGSDESGKGDYFGPLVVSAVAVTRDNWRTLLELGVQDSKRLSDARIASLSAEIASALPHEIVTISPRRYNELWTKFGNVNRLLAWAHARAIENVLERVPDATVAVADQFGDESLIRKALFNRGREVSLVQMHRAEADPAVAAASILARAEFVRRLAALSREAGVLLPKGAGAPVDAVARSLVARSGRAVLDGIAKVHFKTTQRVT